ncbi:hypothetical protein MMC32_003630 [Xylographa parallela]|nr:hypothetical protein [Xylographa parallela]
MGKLRTLWVNLYSIVSYTPKRCRYDPANPPGFSMPLNLLFGFAATFTVANLYYNHPILNVLADDFGVTYEAVSVVPTLMQAGGELLSCGWSGLRERSGMVSSTATIGNMLDYQLSSLHVFGTSSDKMASFRIGLCLTRNFQVFLLLSFLTALTTVTPQLMLPLVGDLAPAHRRATALSIVVSGLLLGMLIARVLSGVVTQYTTWRDIYWLSFGLQYLILILLWLFMPDYPSTNPGGLNYFKMLWSIITITIHEPVLVQACLVGFFTSSTFTSFWTTLTFLLSEPPYDYNNLIIGLFALIGVGSMCFGPPYSRFIIDKFVPLFSVILGEFICITGIAIGTYTGTFTIAGPVIQAFAIDLGLQTSQIANRSAIYAIAPKARNRVNTAYMVSVFCGQLMGTAVGNDLFAKGGWIRSGSASVGFIAAALVICFSRGPWETGWVGWHGGWSIRRRDLGPPKSDVEKSEGQQNGSLDDDESAREKMADEMAGEPTRGTEVNAELMGEEKDMRDTESSVKTGHEKDADL